MPDNLPNITLPQNEWVDLYDASNVDVGIALSIENVGVCDVYLAVQETKPSANHDSYNIIKRSGPPLKNSEGDSGAWAFCNSVGGKINAYPVDAAGFYPPVRERTIGDSEGKELILEPDGSLPVTKQDNSSPPIFVKANKVVGTTTLAATVISDGTNREMTVTSSAGMVVGHYTGLFNLSTNRFYVGVIISINANLIEMDSPFDSDFEIGDTVGFGVTNMAVAGTPAAPQVFSLRGADPGLQLTADITRILFTCVTSDPVNLTDFGDITGGLSYGILFRRTDGTVQNYVNFKTNIEMKGWMLDWQSLDDTNPGQGLHGFVARLTFNGDEKLGVVSRIGPSEALEIVIQDDLGQLISFEAMFEGHIAFLGGA